jgi:hypothetical protein
MQADTMVAINIRPPGQALLWLIAQQLRVAAEDLGRQQQGCSSTGFFVLAVMP